MEAHFELEKIVKTEPLLIFKDKLKYRKSLILPILFCFLSRTFRYYRCKLVYYFRMFNFYSNKIGHLLRKFYCGRQYGKYSLKLRCQINYTNLGEGFSFEHPNIVINKNAVIAYGLYCVCKNCIGSTDKSAPIFDHNVFLD